MTDQSEIDDFAALVEAISADAPVGVDLRADFSPQSIYFRLRDARAEARASERASESAEEPAAQIPQWRQVEALAREALSTQTKDLEIAAWFTEALVRRSGLNGLAAGVKLITALAEKYWEIIYPSPDEDGVSTKVAPISGLNGEGGDGTLIQPLRKITLFNRPDGAPLAFWQYGQAAEVSAIGDETRKQQRLASGVLAYDTIQNEARAAGQTHFAALRQAAQAAHQNWTEMSAIFDHKAGSDAPPTSRVRDILQQIMDIASEYAPVRSDSAEEDVPMPSEIENSNTSNGATPARGGATREDMLVELGRIAAYFRKSEPQSPLAYTLDEAVRRGRMTWPELITELVPETQSRAAILSSLGIKPNPE